MKTIKNILLIIVGKWIAFTSKLLNMGNGSTWPGHSALSVNPQFVKDILRKSKTKVVVIAGTNGKTTTGKLIQTMLEQEGQRVFQNSSGANLLNGIASSLLIHSSISGKLLHDYAVFEVDENTLPLLVKECTPNFLIVLNIFRDQLDRYGETDTIAKKWEAAIRALPASTTLILNADDPQIAYLGKNTKTKTLYFGLDNKKLHQKAPQHAVDSTYCPNCQNKLTYTTVYFSHIGDWECKHCKYKRPPLTVSKSPLYPLSGIYNMYNTHAALLFAQAVDIDAKAIHTALHEFSPAFGRQEIIAVEGKNVQLFLCKNPTSFNESLRTIIEKGAKNLLIVLNDRIPDGRDVSWIWDADFKEIKDSRGPINVAGDRVYDMALRLKYAGVQLADNQIHTDLGYAIKHSLSGVKNNETLYILPTYSAMLEIRKILTGRKIL